MTYGRLKLRYAKISLDAEPSVRMVTESGTRMAIPSSIWLARIITKSRSRPGTFRRAKA